MIACSSSISIVFFIYLNNNFFFIFFKYKLYLKEGIHKITLFYLAANSIIHFASFIFFLTPSFFNKQNSLRFHCIKMHIFCSNLLILFQFNSIKSTFDIFIHFHHFGRFVHLNYWSLLANLMLNRTILYSNGNNACLSIPSPVISIGNDACFFDAEKNQTWKKKKYLELPSWNFFSASHVLDVHC